MRQLRIALRAAVRGGRSGGAGGDWVLEPALPAAAPGGYALLRAPLPLAAVCFLLRQAGCRALLPAEGSVGPPASVGAGRGRRAPRPRWRGAPR